MPILKSIGSDCVAERVRFELTVVISHGGFQDRYLKPLGHLSLCGAQGGIRTHDVVLPNRLTRAVPSTTWQPGQKKEIMI